MRPSETGKRHTRLLRRVKDAAIVLVLSVALMIGVELFLRTFFPQRLDGTSIQGQRFSMRDPQIGMRYVPGAHWHFTHPEYTEDFAEIYRESVAALPVEPVPEARDRIERLRRDANRAAAAGRRIGLGDLN